MTIRISRFGVLLLFFLLVALFIGLVITHQQRTMSIADALYGITMRSDGVTAVVSQKMDRSS